MFQLRPVLHEKGNSLPATNARGSDPVAQFRAPQFTTKSNCQAETRCGKRMPDSDCAAVHVQFFEVELQFTLHGEDLGAKGFVNLEAVDGVESKVASVEKFADGRRR